jgi:glutathione peroxidase
MSETLYDIPVTRIDSTPTSLEAYRGKVLLIVNVASKCGLTPQYEKLEHLYREQSERGLVVLGFPANNFKGQEPGTDQEIADFCSTKYDVSFPMFSKLSVTGADQHPLYSALTKAQPEAIGTEAFREKLKGYGMTPAAPPEVLWNFEKFLVNREGEVIGRFSPDLDGDDPRLLSAIDAALAA